MGMGHDWIYSTTKNSAQGEAKHPHAPTTLNTGIPGGGRGIRDPWQEFTYYLTIRIARLPRITHGQDEQGNPRTGPDQKRSEEKKGEKTKKAGSLLLQRLPA